MPALDPAWIALIGTLFGGIGLKVADHYLSKKRTRVDDASRIRDELRSEIDSQREEIIRLETERDKWRLDYYDLRDKFRELQTDLSLALQDIKVQATKAEAAAQPPPPDPAN